MHYDLFQVYIVKGNIFSHNKELNLNAQQKYSKTACNGYVCDGDEIGHH